MAAAKKGSARKAASESSPAVPDTSRAAGSDPRATDPNVETKDAGGPPANKARGARRAEGGAASADDTLGYGEETDEAEHKRSGYTLPEHFYHVPESLEKAKDNSTAKPVQDD